jgi:hypothetical protein
MRNSVLRAASSAFRTPHSALFIAAIVALAIAYQVRAPITLDMASPDEEIYLKQGFYPPEETAGVTYRWTSGDAQIDLPGVGSGIPLKLQLNLQEFRPAPLSPQAVTISLNGNPVIEFTPGVELAAYHFDLPTISNLQGEAILDLHSDTFTPKGLLPNSTDERSLGLFVDQLKLEYGSGLIVPPLLVWIWLLIAPLSAYAFGRTLNWGTRINVGLGLLILAIEIVGVIAFRTWTAHNSPWWTGTLVSLWLIALRLKHAQATMHEAPVAVAAASSETLRSKIGQHKSELIFVLAVFLVWRIALVLVPIAGVNVVGVSECCPQVDPKPLSSWQQAAFGDWYRWDAIWYGSIAQNGYQYFGTREASNVAFFPLFPVIAGIVNRISDLPIEAAGPIVSSLLTLLACWLLYRLTLRETDDPAAARRSIVYWLAFPAAYYLAIGFSEATYVVCVLAAFILAREGRWGWAGLACFLAGLARLHGALLIVPLAYEYLWQQHWNWRSTFKPKVLSLFGAPIGVLAFMGYLGLQFGQPLAYFEIQTLFFKGIRAEAFPTFPGTTLANYLNGLLNQRPTTESVAVMGAMILLIVLTLEVWAQLPRVYGVYMLTVTLFSLTSGDLISMPRFVIPMFPGFVALGLLGKRPWIDRAILIVSILLQGVLALMFTKGYWIA